LGKVEAASLGAASEQWLLSPTGLQVSAPCRGAGGALEAGDREGVGPWSCLVKIQEAWGKAGKVPCPTLAH
jgi:hypothetical protein